MGGIRSGVFPNNVTLPQYIHTHRRTRYKKGDIKDPHDRIKSNNYQIQRHRDTKTQRALCVTTQSGIRGVKPISIGGVTLNFDPVENLHQGS